MHRGRRTTRSLITATAFLLVASMACQVLLADASESRTSVTARGFSSGEKDQSAQPIERADGVEQAAGAQEPPRPRAAEPIRPVVPLPAAARDGAAALFAPSESARELLTQERRQRASGPSTNVVLGAQGAARVASDAGSLLGKSNSAPGVAIQKRTPITTDTRSRGSHAGQLLASGSYWVPARQDLDTMLSKIDSRIVSDVIVIKGPYSARYGPGFSFFDVSLLDAPRYAGGFEAHGSTSACASISARKLHTSLPHRPGVDRLDFRPARFGPPIPAAGLIADTGARGVAGMLRRG